MRRAPEHKKAEVRGGPSLSPSKSSIPDETCQIYGLHHSLERRWGGEEGSQTPQSQPLSTLHPSPSHVSLLTKPSST
uniref:Bis(5'-nucleosyl)-tetraphosphatase asymmetrical isoform X1-like n=1 Tax=Sus scrofa TaxID=9823 RepID=A0A480KN34_PIG